MHGAESNYSASLREQQQKGKTGQHGNLVQAGSPGGGDALKAGELITPAQLGWELGTCLRPNV